MNYLNNPPLFFPGLLHLPQQLPRRHGAGIFHRNAVEQIDPGFDLLHFAGIRGDQHQPEGGVPVPEALLPPFAASINPLIDLRGPHVVPLIREIKLSTGAVTLTGTADVQSLI
jgi:hypothetical protein